MPPNLLEMSRNRLREVFSSVMPKKIFTLDFQRQYEDNPNIVIEIFKKLDDARRHRGIVCAKPEAIKSALLKMVELLHIIEKTDVDAFRIESNDSSSHAVNEEKHKLAARMRARSDMADAVVSVLCLFREGTLIMDEVDVILHPLKSELNYPIDMKSPIDLSPARWDLPAHLLSVIFPPEHAKALEAPEAWSKAEQIAGYTLASVSAQVHEMVEHGKQSHKMQRNPHLVLLDPQFYHECLKPLTAKWMLLWLHRTMTDDITEQEGITNGVLITYLTGFSVSLMGSTEHRGVLFKKVQGVCSRMSSASAIKLSTMDPGIQKPSTPSEYAQVVDELGSIACLANKVIQAIGDGDEKATEVIRDYVGILQWEQLQAARQVVRMACQCDNRISERSMKLINLAASWCQQFLPHVLSKIDRVTFGLLGEFDPLPPDAPLVRKYMAVPFIAKDVPSHAAEFAHPDILIGLTILAYRYEGLRIKDIKRIIKQVKYNFSREQGDKATRPSALQYNLWVELGKLANAIRASGDLLQKLEARQQAHDAIQGLVNRFETTGKFDDECLQEAKDSFDTAGLPDQKAHLESLVHRSAGDDEDLLWAQFLDDCANLSQTGAQLLGGVQKVHELALHPHVDVAVVSEAVMGLVLELREAGLDGDATAVLYS